MTAFRSSTRTDNVITLTSNANGIIGGTRAGGLFTARYDLFIIGHAWRSGCDLEDLADGYGFGMGTCGGDWSGIRDSSDTAILRMVERALNFLEM